MSEESTSKSTSGGTPVSAKYSPTQLPVGGWSYVPYKNKNGGPAGGGFRCPNCGLVFDGADVDGHKCT